MKIKIVQLKYLLVLAFLTLNAHAEFNEMVVFGDSLSDTGNFASINGAFPSPPFFQASRVSNGPVAVEGLAEKLGLSVEASLHLVANTGGSNFAVAAARAGGNTPIDLTSQVGAYLLRVGGFASADSLFVMFIGGNDIRDTRDLSRRDARETLSAAAAAIDQQLRLLIAAGAEHILVVNSANIGAIPEIRLLADENNKHLANQMKRHSIQFNRKLARKVRRIEYDTGLDLVLFDLFSYLQKIFINSEALAYTNTVDACFSTEMLAFNPDCEFGQRFDEYLFFDEIHLTGRSHERVSRAMFAEVPEKL